MTVYIALLRGINVGGKNKMKMADLKGLFESLGLARVETYIQSGNVIFESNENEGNLKQQIEHAIQSTLDLSATVILRTAAEFERLILNLPFTEEEVSSAESANSEGESLYAAILSQAPSPEMLDYLTAFANKGDQLRIINRDIYLLFDHSIRNSRLANNLAKLGAAYTVRNWKTINGLYSLVKTRT